MTPYQSNLDYPLIKFPCKTGVSEWPLRVAVTGLQIFGSTGSGKSSSSARAFITSYLRAGFGGCILTVKRDEKELIESYCKETGRINDLIVIEPGGKNSFDFLKYLSTHHDPGTSNNANILETLTTVIRAGEQKTNGKTDDRFWEDALNLLLISLLDLCKLAYDEISIELLYDILLTVPKNAEGDTSASDKKVTAFEKAFTIASKKVKDQIAIWYQQLPKEEKEKYNDPKVYDDAVMNSLSNVRIIKSLDLFFFETFKNLSDKTRSIVEFSFSSFLSKLLRDPFYSMFSAGKVDLKPEDCFDGKIILLNIPVKLYHKIGRDCQIMFKYIWQEAMEKRDIKINDRPVFLFADEAQHFTHEHDAVFQNTARSCRICTVYVTQNLPNYNIVMGGSNGTDRVKSFLGTMGTKIFHANSDVDTNRYASELIGDAIFLDPSTTVTTAENFSKSDSLSLKLDKEVRPEEMVGLATGGSQNNFLSEAYIHVQGDPLFNKKNFKKVKFSQININN